MLNMFSQYEYVRLAGRRPRLTHHVIHQAVNNAEPHSTLGSRLNRRVKGGTGLQLIHSLMDEVTRKTASAPGEPNILVLCKHVEHRRAP